MTKRIFQSICFVALAVFLASILLIAGVFYEYFSNIQQAQLKMQVRLAAQGIAHEGLEYFRGLKGEGLEGCRITWIAEDGTVLYDSQSDTADMENHLEREEIKEALATGYGESRRYSVTLMERSLYSAQLLPDDTILRLSISQNSIFMLIFGMTQPIYVIFAVAVILSVILSVRIAKKIVSPLNELDLDRPLSNQGYDELLPLLRRMDSQQEQLRQKETELRWKQKELDTIIGSMKEGMILLNQKGKILSINSTAKRILGTKKDCVRADLLSVNENPRLEEILPAVLKGGEGEEMFAVEEENYRIFASPIISGDMAIGTALFFFNMTGKEKTERLRREFTANVSHELKTPLHSISGYAELMKSGWVKEEDILPFANKIYVEAQRMICLVEDIISLSHLDEGAGDTEREYVDFYGLAGKAAEDLMPQAKAAHVAVEVSGVPFFFYGNGQLLYSIVYNLCDNAIKYNREGGRVDVRVDAEGGEVILSVRDTGIGIAKEHQERIFERFYRVDKSRSKAVGGTGLGLSIVKHAAKICGAQIEVESAEGEGTAVTVRFYKDTALQQTGTG